MAEPPPPRFYTDEAEFPVCIEYSPIGVIRSPHRERHGTPRQAHLSATPSDRASERSQIVLFDQVSPEHSLQDLEGFQYVWILASLHLNKGWNPKVMPPRGPRIKRGLFATRAPHRPNAIGLSAAEIESVEGNIVHLKRVDLLDGTPVLDIKPYLPSADAFPEATAGWVDVLER